MVKKASRRLVYALSSAQTETGGHSLGVNALAIDPTAGGGENGHTGTLYSAGRDGIINAWALTDVDVTTKWDTEYIPRSIGGSSKKKKDEGSTATSARTQIHTNWVNDILLVNNYQSVISCSSDLTVKLWTPSRNETVSVGQHLDYVKCLASPSLENTEWIVSGGLDRKIIGWDLVRGGEKFSIDVGDKGKNQMGSIYTLAVNKGVNPVIASGGPESIVNLWDSRTTEAITKFVGHNGNIRSVLVSDDGEWVLSGSSDSSIKLWSVTSSRLFHTFDMHDDSVWSLYSQDSDLRVFYSSDRTGMVIKTDLRGCVDRHLDFDEGVSCVVCNEHEGVSKIVSAGSNLWTATSNSRIHRWKNVNTGVYSLGGGEVDEEGEGEEEKEKEKEKEKEEEEKEKDEKHEAKVKINGKASIKTSFLQISGGPSLEFTKTTPPSSPSSPIDISLQPTYDNPIETLRGHVGLIKHRLLNDKRRVLTLDTAGDVKLWDLIKGVVLQSFDRTLGLDIDTLADQLNPLAFVSNWCQVSVRTGELYVSLEESTCFDSEVYSDDLVINLGEDETDNEPRDLSEVPDDHRVNYGRWVITNLLYNLQQELLKEEQIISPKESNNSSTQSGGANGTVATKQTTHSTSPYDVVHKVEDPPETAKDANANNQANAQSNTSTGGSFMGKFKGFGKSKKDKGPSANAATAKPLPAVPATTTLPHTPPEYTSLNDLIKALKKKHIPYNPPPSVDAPIITFPVHTKIMISEQLPNSGDTMDLYRGTVGTAGTDIVHLKEVIPGWIGRVLLENELPTKEPPKVGFVVQPDDSTPTPTPVVTAANIRLTAYHMLRARKILLYVVERLSADPSMTETLQLHANDQPEDWLQLYCQGHKIPPKMTVATIRTRVWRSGGDVVLKYRIINKQ